MKTTTFLGAGLFLTIAGIGCSVIVSADVPEFSCDVRDPRVCPSGQVCDLTLGKCVVPSDAPTVDQTDGDEPDAEDVPDADPTPDSSDLPHPLGAQCRLDADCESNLCGTSNMLTTPIVTDTGPICTKTCCTSKDCPADFVCFGAGTGGNYCVPSSKAGRIPAASGGKLPGATCSGASDCRSGLCQAGKCVDTCCMPADCTNGTVCQVATLAGPGPSHDVWMCAAVNAAASKANGDTCTNVENECKNNNCIGNKCRESCCSVANCESQGRTGGHCRYGESGSDRIKFCEYTTTGLADEAKCTQDSDCQSDFCDPETKKCAWVCCRDADCAGNKVCRPSGIGLPFLRCVSLR